MKNSTDHRWYMKKYGLTKDEAEAFLALDQLRRQNIETDHGHWTNAHGLAPSSPLSRGAFRDRVEGTFR